MSVNKVIVLGRLGQDPELKYTPSGAAVCTLSVATSEAWTDKSGQKQERTEWHRAVVWGKLAELCGQYLGKGRQVYLEGRLQTRSWEKDGQKRYTTEINANVVQFLDSKSSGQSSTTSRPAQNDPYSQDSNNGGGGDFMDQSYNVSSDSNFTADDIPF